MTLVTDGDLADEDFVIEDLSVGVYASGFGRLDGGKTFSFHVERQTLVVEVYRPRLAGPVPGEEDVVATSTRSMAHVDVNDERSLGAAVKDAVADAQPVPRSGR
jgi:hypothetical protein